MINLNDPLAVLAGRLPWELSEAFAAAKFVRQERADQVLQDHDMFGPTMTLVGAGRSNARRPKLGHSFDGQLAVPQAQLQPK
jgi:hypothetical protein